MHPLTGCRTKLGRAETDLDQLEAEIARFLRRDSYEIAQQFDAETGRCTLTFLAKHPPPLAWSVAIGEIVHNLRSALDHMACALYLQSGGTDCARVKSASGTAKTAFPILVDDSDKGFGKWMDTYLPGLPDDAVAELQELQPYKRGDTARIHPLAILNRLWNQDKHRLLVPVFAAPVPGGFGMIGLREYRDVDPRLPSDYVIPEGPLGKKAELAQLEFTVTGPDPYVEVEPHIPIDIAFSDGGPVIDILRLIGGEVSTDYFPRFLRFFPQPLSSLPDPEPLPAPKIVSR